MGLDIAQNSAVAQLERADGSKCWRGTVATDQTGCAELQRVMAEHRAEFSATLAVLEATGVYHLPWADRLLKAGAEVFVLNPLLAAQLQSAANALRQQKTDRIDVARLCETARL